MGMRSGVETRTDTDGYGVCGLGDGISGSFCGSEKSIEGLFCMVNLLDPTLGPGIRFQ